MAALPLVLLATAADAASDTLLPPGDFSTRGSQIVDRDGRPVRLACVGWNQVNEEISLEHQTTLMAEHGFNCIRFSWVNATLERDLARIDRVVRAAARANLRLVLDNHTNEPGHGERDNWGAQQRNGLWYDRGGSSDDTDGGSDDGSDPPAALDAAAASEVAAVIADAGNGTVVDAYESVKHVALAAVDMRRLVTRHFGSVRLAEVPSAPAAPAPASAVPLPASPARSTQFLWALLPPRHILLVRLVMAPDATVVTFRSDSWRPHAYVDALMDRLVAEAEQADPVRDA